MNDVQDAVCILRALIDAPTHGPEVIAKVLGTLPALSPDSNPRARMFDGVFATGPFSTVDLRVAVQSGTTMRSFMVLDVRDGVMLHLNEFESALGATLVCTGTDTDRRGSDAFAFRLTVPGTRVEFVFTRGVQILDRVIFDRAPTIASHP